MIKGLPMRQRKFITLLGGVAGWPLIAHAQQPTLPVMGYISSSSAGDSSTFIAAFRQGLGQAGYAEGRNIIIEYRFAEHRSERLSALAAASGKTSASPKLA